MKWLAFVTLVIAACGDGTIKDACSQEAVCPMGGRYQLCTDAMATKAYYRRSEGEPINCVSASDCAKATDEIVAWCQAH